MRIRNLFKKAAEVNLEVTKNEKEKLPDIPPQECEDIPMSPTDTLVIELSSKGRVVDENYYIITRSSTLRSLVVTNTSDCAGEKDSEMNLPKYLTINIPPQKHSDKACDEKDDVSIGPEPPGTGNV